MLGRVVGGPAVGWLAGLLVATSPLHVRYAQEARMYALLAMLAALAMLGLAWLLRSPDAAAAPFFGRLRSALPGRRVTGARGPAWLAYIVGMSGTLLTHNTSTLLLLGANLVVFVSRGRRVAHPGFLRNWLLAYAAVLVIWSV